MGAHRWFPVAAAVSTLVVSLAGCGAGASGSDGAGSDGAESESTGGRPSRWSVSVIDPGPGAYEQCLEDPRVEEAFVSADYPASHMGVTLTADATADDAGRIADCLQQALPSAEVSVAGPGSG
ncbi:hypothetical protein LJ753_02750 [Arthrobacter sp. zg-Y20]|uniref:hypothetical protein n=1 Tax=unclassified Arthrobacter TaxID=235627 RepID=UPI001D14971B|nr:MULTISPECIES: hypothetical protein [unclassified Arthrobacter]MCC3274791.1 hypothetical protein [Arthrobacter sp. zg-Y20]MDK1314947.1 hypothetical protein [Arthrobacter sp. zg.Y20]WIB04801.1 hypothetical protein QNO06_09495 [Arthrobacter sp. zg-Y20]